jgi:spermidine synthase
VSPVAVKAALRDPRTAGRTIGSLYAWGSATSILGAFLAGFFLIAALGMTLVIHVVAILLAFTAIAFQHRSKAPYICAAVCIGALAIGVAPLPAVENIGRKVGLRDSPPPGTVYANESQYSYIAITQDEEQPNIREMVLDRLIHSRVNLENPRELRYEYEWVYTAVLDKYYPEGKPIEALVIGGGGYTYPHYLEATRPGSRIDVAEIDPAVTEAAFAAFGLPRDTSIGIFNMDARNFVDDALSAEPLRRYDCILGDSVNDYSVPYHLTTFEFNEKLSRLLKDDGIYLLNLIDLFNSGRFLGAVVNTCRRTFAHVYVFNSRNNPARRDTFVVVNTKRALDLTAVTDKVRALYGCQGELLDEGALAQLRVNAGDSVLTDDFAPVDIMLAPVARTSRETYPAHLIENANKMIAEGRFDDAIVVCRLVLRSGISTTEARQLLAKALWHNQKYDQAWEQVHQLQADGQTVDPDFLESLKRDSGRNE